MEAATQSEEKPTVSLVAETHHPEGNSKDGIPGFFKSAEWSADGTTIFTSSSTNTVHSYILPTDLLTAPSPLTLTPQGILTLPEPTNALAPSPYFSLQNTYSHLILTAPKDHPIQLHGAFNQLSTPSPPLASYPLIHGPTEAYQSPNALLWPSPGTHFLAGTKNLIAYFDINRSGSGTQPILRIPTIPSARTNAKGGGVGMRGTVACLAVPAVSENQNDWGSGLVAAGTWTRWVGLYDLMRAGECVATWSVKDADREFADYGSQAVGGNGILQTVWSPDGRYLVVNERKAGGLLVYDVRGTGRLLAVLVGREGDTNQRLSCDVYPAAEGKRGFEVWAGGKDGRVFVWEGVGELGGNVQPDWEWRGHGSAVGSTAMHLYGSVVATCSGEWTLVDQDQGDDGSGSDELQPRIKVGESSLKIWSIKSPTAGKDNTRVEAKHDRQEGEQDHGYLNMQDERQDERQGERQDASQGNGSTEQLDRNQRHRLQDVQNVTGNKAAAVHDDQLNENHEKPEQLSNNS